ncbi:hypothetical protein NXF25_020268 [Crotalus adamanteus]|uniref:Retrotransposon gag domain-containing protein n=1 Tax=Crotalus adamanteus TaxID=8729 RepID=A0AAW1B523_CROAD
MNDAVATNLEGEAADWMSGLQEEQAPELWNFDLFMRGLRARFKDESRLYKWKKTSMMLSRGVGPQEST